MVARLGELSSALTSLGASSNPYDKSFAGCDAPKHEDEDPMRQPYQYHDLDPDRIRLFGTGHFDATDFLGDELAMPYRAPEILLHGLGPGEGPLIRDHASSLARLALNWDSLDLLHIHAHPIDPNSLVRIFGATKDLTTDRQIGDRRGRNALEARVQGPSHLLPSGPDLCELYVNPKTHKIRLSITDRKDFYHQFWCSESRAVSNTIGPCVPLELLRDTKAFSHFLIQKSRMRRSRAIHGDELRRGTSVGLAPEEGHAWVSFRSILQGDHAGVDMATESHTNLLASGGLLGFSDTICANRPLRNSSNAQGLVIDDYFSVSVEPNHYSSEDSLAFQHYVTAGKIYEDHNILGSPHKDVIAAEEGRAIGAYINGSQAALNRGVAPLMAPAKKRLAMSWITLQLCKLSHTSDALHLCLVGGWISILGYRRTLMSLLQDVFYVVDLQKFDRNSPKIIPMSRAVACELTLLAVLMPLAFTDLAAPFDPMIYCTDASQFRGAALSAHVGEKISEVLWKTSRSKGAYSRLLSPSEVMLKHLGELDEDSLERQRVEPERPIAFAFEFIEVFAGASKISDRLREKGVRVGPPLDLSLCSEYNLEHVHVISWLTHLIAESRLLAFVAGPPCTTFSIMRRPRLRSAEVPFGFDVDDNQTKTGNILAHRGGQLMKVAAQNDASGILGTPYPSYMKHLPFWKQLKEKPGFKEVRCDSCRYGSPHLKSFRLLGVNVCMTGLALRCKCKHKHVQVQGSLKRSQRFIQTCWPKPLQVPFTRPFLSVLPLWKRSLLCIQRGSKISSRMK